MKGQMIRNHQSRHRAARSRTGSFSTLLIVAALLAIVTPLRADNPLTYLFQIDSSAVPGGFDPLLLALDSSNNVYVSEGSNSRIVKFSGGGAYLTQWGSYGTSNGQFSRPLGIAVDSSNNVYVADDYNRRIEKFTSNGNYLTQWGSYGTNNGQFIDPYGIAVDSSNNVYVTDGGNYRVQKFTSSGNYLTQWGSSGSGNGQFNFPSGIAVDSSNNVYVADYGNHRVEKFTSSGNYLTQWGSSGSGNGQFNGPFGIAVDSSNNVYVVDSYNARVEKFTSSGSYLTQWGSYGSGKGQFEYPVGIAVDSSGNVIYVADSGNSRIEVFVNNTNIVPPYISLEPANQIVAAGVNVTFSVGVIGTAPFAYQWSSNNVAVPGATNATLTLTNVSPADSGNYAVLVTNNYGSELSSKAVLAVLPALVTTQPASGRSATGAVLNGSITLGSNETVVWFEWGTDTNYGNITGATVVPGNNASNDISAPLSGLPGNFYHYRMDTANDFGIVYGQDQLFTVGFAPTATTLPPTNGANGVTLEAAVNPEGWDTIVYFQWETPIPTYTTPPINIGAGAASLNVSNFVPGLALLSLYPYRVVASNALGTAFGNFVYGPSVHRYLFSGSKTNITLPAGTYIITAYGAPGAYPILFFEVVGGYGGLGALMSAEFNFSTPTTLTLLVGGGGLSFGPGESGGGGGGSFVVQGSTPLVVAGGGGGGAHAGNGNNNFPGGNGNVSNNGGGYCGGGGTNGGGGNGDYHGGGGGGGGFLGNGADGTGGYLGGGGGGSSFETGGTGGFGGFCGDYGCNGPGGYGGGGGGGSGSGVGAGGGGGGYSGGAGGGYCGVLLRGGGGGGGSIIDSSAIAILSEVSGTISPDDPPNRDTGTSGNGEIIITAVPTPLLITTGAAFGFTNSVFGFNVIGPSGSNVVIQASTDLQTWIPLQTNLLGTGPLYFSDPQSPTNPRRFYRLQLSP